jgi:hypothetical protein
VIHYSRLVGSFALVALAACAQPTDSNAKGGGASPNQNGGTGPGGAGPTGNGTPTPPGGRAIVAKSDCAPSAVTYDVPKTAVKLASFFIDMVAADVNGDGKADLVVLEDNGLEVFVGKGDGSFEKGVLHEGHRTANGALAAVDLHGTGVPDVISSMVNPDQQKSFSLFTNKGDGTFGSASFLDVTTNSTTKMMAADLNGDGKVDFLYDTADSGCCGPSGAALNAGGTLNAPRSLDLGGHWTAADLDGDGAAEIVLTPPTRDLQGTCVLKNDGRGGFAKTPTCFAGPAAGDVDRIASGDIDGDGKPDIVSVYGTLVESERSNVAAYLTRGGTLADPKLFNIPGHEMQGVTLGDVNNDGKADLVVFSHDTEASSLVRILLSKGDGTFADPIDMAAGRIQSGSEQNPRIADFAGDGLRGIAVHNSAAEGVDVIMARCRK